MVKSLNIDDHFTRDQIRKCVDELCRAGVARGRFDVSVLIYVLSFLSQFQFMHDVGGDFDA